MSTSFGAPALNPRQRYLKALLFLRRFVDRSVADMLANWERQALQLMPNQLVEGGRASLRPWGIETAALRSAVASLLASTVTRAPTVRIPDCSGGPRNTKNVCSDPIGF